MAYFSRDEDTCSEPRKVRNFIQVDVLSLEALWSKPGQRRYVVRLCECLPMTKRFLSFRPVRHLSRRPAGRLRRLRTAIETLWQDQQRQPANRRIRFRPRHTRPRPASCQARPRASACVGSQGQRRHKPLRLARVCLRVVG